jgi:hypothetical protein
MLYRDLIIMLSMMLLVIHINNKKTKPRHKGRMTNDEEDDHH